MLKAALESILETLAEVEHDRWAHWQRYLHSKGQLQKDGSLILPSDMVSRWERQLSTPYPELTEEEKESDRTQVRRYLPIIFEQLSRAS
jgi:hypothetical protein